MGCAVTRSQGGGVEVADFFLDPAGKPYFLLADSRLITANPLGGNSYSFFDSSLGAPDYVDVTDPFQLLVYYREYGTVLVLDRTLNELSRIDLFANPNIEQPGAIARSYDGGVWVFDDWSYQLLQIDARGEVARRTNNLRLQLREDIAPGAIFVSPLKVMLYFAEEERARLAVFTNYGEFERWVELPPAAELSWNNPTLLGRGPAGNWLWSPGSRDGIVEIGPLPERLLRVGRLYVGGDELLWADPTRLGVEREHLP